MPQLRGFNFVGGMRVIPEFVALLVGADDLYRRLHRRDRARRHPGGVAGQTEAALALGLRARQTLRLVVMPQALRVIVPPLTNQYLNLTKNSSLAVAIGYPDLFAVFAGTTLNQTGQAIEIIAITMAVYLVDLADHQRADELVQRAHAAGGALTMSDAQPSSSARDGSAASRRRSRAGRGGLAACSGCSAAGSTPLLTVVSA